MRTGGKQTEFEVTQRGGVQTGRQRTGFEVKQWGGGADGLGADRV